MKCPKCGRENTPGAPFCADCGKNLFADRSDHAPSAEPSTQSAAEPVPMQAAEVVVDVVEQEPETAAPVNDALANDAVPTPFITDGAIHIDPLTEPESVPAPVSVSPSAAVSESAPHAAPEPKIEQESVIVAVSEPGPMPEPGSEAAPEPEPIPDPEPVAKFEGAFDNPPAPEAQTKTGEASGQAVHAEESEPLGGASSAPAEAGAAAKPNGLPEQPAVAAPKAAAAEAPQAPATPEPGAEEAPKPESSATPEPQFTPFATTPIVPPNPARPHQTSPQPGGEMLYKKGCLAAAWDDITQSKGWFGRLLLLGLVNCVPVLNFYVSGYAMRWSRELFLGKVAAMPERIFGNRMFVNGFFAFVISLVIGIVLGVCGAILDFIPIVGTLCYLVLSFLVTAFQYLAVMRAAVADRLGAGFDVSQVWRAGKRNLGALCCATIVPSLIVTAILCVVIIAVMLIMGIPLIGAISDASYSHYSMSGSAYLGVVLSLLVMMIPMFLVIYVLSSFVGAFLEVLVMRATGHYVARYAQDWKGEQAVMSTAYINGI